MMKDGISKHNSQLSVLSRAFSPRAIEKSKTTEVLWSTCTSFPWKKLEPRNGLNINDLLRNSLNSKLTLLMTFVETTYEERRDILPKNIRQEGRPFQVIYRIPLFLMPLSIPFQSKDLHIFVYHYH